MKISDYFGTYKKNNFNTLNKYMSNFNKKLSDYYNFGNAFFKGKYALNYGNFLKEKELNKNTLPPEKVFEYMASYFECLPNYNNPGTMINVIPPVNLVSLSVTNIMNLYNPNFAQDTYAGMLIKSELEVSKYLSDLVGWNYKKTHGVFTFGGKGTNLYATKVAINKADKNAAKEGCSRGKYFMLTSKTGHPCHYEVCNWLGIGTDNCYEIDSDCNGKMDLEEARKIIEENLNKGKMFLGINLTAGSTNELYVDPIKETYNLIHEIVKKYNLNYIPHIHADAVLGWVYLFFNNYDFINNPLNINDIALSKIRSLNKKIKELKYADSIGIDFHKTGFCNYISSIVLFKNKNDYFTLCEKDNIPIDELEYGNYNPYHSTLELTRAGNGPISALCALKSFGVIGFQTIISSLFSSTEYFRNLISKNENVCVINENTEGLATLFIIKPKEFKDMDLNSILKLDDTKIKKIRDYNINYSKYVLNKAINNEISFCYTSSRSYVVPGTNIKIGALKAYPMSVFLDLKETKRIVKEINKTIEEYSILSNKKYDNGVLSDDMVYREK